MLDGAISEVFNFLNFDNIDFGELAGNFTGISDKEFEGKVSFVDGGNLELVKAPNFSIHLMRFYFNIFQKNKKQKIENNFFEYLCLAKAVGNKTYTTKLIPLNKNSLSLTIEDLKFDATEPSLVSEGKPASISAIPQKVRRIMEWKLVSEVINNKLTSGDFIVMDGTLQFTFTNEAKFSKQACESALSKNVFLTALAKTSTLMTNTGFPLLSAISLKANSRENAWYYYPIKKTSPVSEEVYAVKLHPKSNYVFKFEHFTKQNPDIQPIFSCLKSNAEDSTFLGYPYGLIDADNYAKIFQNEKNAYLSFLFPKLSKLRKFIISTDAHDLLNLIW